ncbi:MAG: TldD/PmbA family protein [Pseudomonadota bacterium]
MLDQSLSLDTIAEQLLDAAKTAGAEAADVVVGESESLSVTARDGKLEEAERQESLDFGLRVFVGQRQASVSASDPAALGALAERAVAMAQEAPEDPEAGLADPGQLATDVPELALLDPAEPPAPEQLLEIAFALEAGVRAVDGVARAEGPSAGWRRGRTVLAATNGFHRGYEAGSHSIGVTALAGEGLEMERDYSFSAARWREDLKSIDEVAKEAGERAVRRLNPRKPKTGACPVIFEPRMAAGLIGSLIAGANGASVARGSSFLKDKMGERILPAGLHIIDDPLKPRGLASRAFDGEGLPVSRKSVFEDGVLSTWLLDLASARKLGLVSNGCASRGVSGAPSPGSSNVWLAAGETTPEALLADMRTGLLITEMMGRGLNPVTGDYSRGATGFWVENGEIAYPVAEITVAGDFLEMVASMIPANDLETDRRIAAPSLLIEGLTVAAE